MRKVLNIILAIFVSVGVANAAVRSANSPTRSTAKNTSSRQTAPGANVTARTTTNITTRTPATITHNTIRNTTSSRTKQTGTTARTASNANASRATIQSTTTSRNSTISSGARPARATISTTTVPSNTFGTGYNICRDAYFTCMDQFCGTANDSYRRCICSSKLTEIQSRERALDNASDQIKNFKDLNISVIDKSANEVNAMLSATYGERAHANARDNSTSASKLAGISAVLSNTKNKSLSTSGTLDIAGDISQIWSTTDLAGGQNISNLTGEPLYNAVHAQCAQMVATQCSDPSTMTMVSSAYGMYIENDCSILINALDKQLTAANSSIRNTEREMQLARLDNYNAHNSTSINDCVAQVRTDITANTACGPDYVHCLDITGLYLHYDTGAPIYSPNFYQLENQISLSGDLLTNQTNRLIVAKLNGMRKYAARGLDTCRDLADDVWDEFMRQAIAEIYQGQQEKIRLVKSECLNVVNECYDKQTNQLKDFSNIEEQLVLGARLELAEEMCNEKLTACSNLYGGGTNGLQELVIAMSDITDQKIGQQCAATLRNFLKKQCAVPGNDTLHSYPYGCRVYAPGDAQYIFDSECNSKTSTTKNDIRIDAESTAPYQCDINKKYTSCKENYVMTYNGVVDTTPKFGNQCLPCPDGYNCSGVTDPPEQENNTGTDNNKCLDTDYIGSMYHMLARYAADTCMRPSLGTAEKYALTPSITQDITTVMTELQSAMSTELATECERQGGTWVNIPWMDDKDITGINTKTIYKQCTINMGKTTCTEVDEDTYNNSSKNLTYQKCTTYYNDDGTIESEKCENIDISEVELGGCIPKTENDNEHCVEYIGTMYITDTVHDFTNDKLHLIFYTETSTNPKWGYCKPTATE